MQHLNRRGMIGTGLALAATPALAKDPRITFTVPDGATDCHHHIYDPRFPYNPNAVLKPPYATVSDYRVLQKKLGTSRNVMVQPSTYGTDNSCVLDVLAQLGENCRAVCVVNSKVNDDELKKLNAAGVRGVRVQFGLGNPVGADEVMPLAGRIAAMGWHIQCNMAPDQLVKMTPLLLSLPVPVIIDHLGRAVDDKGPQYVAVRKLLDSGHGWVKLSGAYLYGGGTPPDYAGASSRPRAISRPRRSVVCGAATGRTPTPPRSSILWRCLMMWCCSTCWPSGRRTRSCAIASWWRIRRRFMASIRQNGPRQTDAGVRSGTIPACPALNSDGAAELGQDISCVNFFWVWRPLWIACDFTPTAMRSHCRRLHQPRPRNADSGPALYLGWPALLLL